jgi:hypothetical protein
LSAKQNGPIAYTFALSPFCSSEPPNLEHLIISWISPSIHHDHHKLLTWLGPPSLNLTLRSKVSPRVSSIIQNQTRDFQPGQLRCAGTSTRPPAAWVGASCDRFGRRWVAARTTPTSSSTSATTTPGNRPGCRRVAVCAPTAPCPLMQAPRPGSPRQRHAANAGGTPAHGSSRLTPMAVASSA